MQRHAEYIFNLDFLFIFYEKSISNLSNSMYLILQNLMSSPTPAILLKIISIFIYERVNFDMLCYTVSLSYSPPRHSINGFQLLDMVRHASQDIPLFDPHLYSF